MPECPPCARRERCRVRLDFYAIDDNSERPAWSAELAERSEALQRELAKNDDIRRAAEALLATTQKLLTPAAPSAGISRQHLIPRRLARWMDDAVGETLPALQAAFRHTTVNGPLAAAYIAAPVGRVMSSGSLALRPLSFTGDGTVDEPEADVLAVKKPKISFLAELSPGQILALTLIWVVAYALPIYLYAQSPSASTLIVGDLGTVSLAYSIHCRIIDKRK